MSITSNFNILTYATSALVDFYISNPAEIIVPTCKVRWPNIGSVVDVYILYIYYLIVRYLLGTGIWSLLNLYRPLKPIWIGNMVPVKYSSSSFVVNKQVILAGGQAMSEVVLIPPDWNFNGNDKLLQWKELRTLLERYLNALKVRQVLYQIANLLSSVVWCDMV